MSRGTLASVGLALSLILTACGAAAPGPMPAPSTPTAAAAPAAGERTQTHEGGQVTVRVTWLGPEAGPVFAVALDTHSVDLDGYDLRRLAVLRTDTGIEVQPSGWDAPAGGHHREGRLTFPATGPDGQPVMDATSLTLVVRDVAGVPERTFRWER